LATSVTDAPGIASLTTGRSWAQNQKYAVRGRFGAFGSPHLPHLLRLRLPLLALTRLRSTAHRPDDLYCDICFRYRAASTVAITRYGSRSSSLMPCHRCEH